MPKRLGGFYSTALVAVALLLTFSLAACERETEPEDVDTGLSGLNDVDIIHDGQTPSNDQGDIEPPGTLASPSSASPRSGAASTSGAATTPPTHGDQVAPTPGDGKVDVGDTMPEPSDADATSGTQQSPGATGGTAGAQ